MNTTSTTLEQSDDHYWAAATDEKTFASDYFGNSGQTSTSIAGLSYIGMLQLLAHEHYFNALPTGFAGSFPSSAQISRSGEQGENIELTVNWLRSHINAKHQIVVAPELAWSCQATTTDSKALADASRGSGILEYLWKSQDYSAKAIQAVLGAIVYGEEFLFTYWFPQAGEQVAYDAEANNGKGQVHYTGDLKCINVSSWDVRRDPAARSFDQSDWLSAKVPVNRWDLIAQFPERREEILKAAAPPSSSLGGLTVAPVGTWTTKDKITAHYFFHKRTPACPNGVQAVLLNDQCVLEFKPLEKCYWRLPIHRVAAGNLHGTPYPYSDVWEAMAIQDLSTDIQGSLATNIVSFAKQMLSAEEGSNLPISQIGNGPAVIYRPKNTPPPVALQLTASPPEAFKHLERLRADQRQILGLNDVSVGEAPTGAPNAQAWALLSSAAITANSGLQRSYVNMVTSVGRSMLEIFKEKMDYPAKISVVGQHGPQLAHQEEYDKSTFAGIEDVIVMIASPLSQTAAGRLQLADMYMEKGFIQTPEQLQSVVETGKLEPLTQVLRDELIFIASENEQILQGITPLVKITDAHQLHIRDHRGPTFNMNARADTKINLAADAHIKAHLDMLLNTDPRILAVLGQASPPPPAAPPPPPGGPQASGAGQDINKPEKGSLGADLQSPLAAQSHMTDIAQPTLPIPPNDPATGQPFVTGGRQ